MFGQGANARNLSRALITAETLHAENADHGVVVSAAGIRDAPYALNFDNRRAGHGGSDQDQSVGHHETPQHPAIGEKSV